MIGIVCRYGRTDRISHRLHRITSPRTANDVEKRLSTLLLYGKGRGKGRGVLYLLFSREPRLYKRVCPSVGRSVRWSVRPSVRRLVGNLFFSAGRNEDGERLISCIRTCYFTEGQLGILKRPPSKAKTTTSTTTMKATMKAKMMGAFPLTIKGHSYAFRFSK